MYNTAKDFRWATRARNTIAPPARASGNQIKLGGGLGFPAELPDIVSEAVAAAERRGEGLQYGPLYGLDDLRDAIVNYLADDGIAAKRENILVVNGAKHALDLACRVFVEKGDTIIVSNPTYMTALNILRNHEVNFLTVGQDHEGMLVDELASRLEARRRRGEPQPKLLFEVPDFHNPTGITMSADRRRRLVELAGEFDFRILEDDPYRRIRFSGNPVPPIKSFDPDGYVIGLGTVSKILAPGLRVGWANADPEIIRRMAAQKSDHGNNPFVQRIVAQLFESGKVDHHIQTLTRVLKVHRDTMIAAVEQHLPGAKVKTPEGGYYLWVQLPDQMDGADLVHAAAAQGVEIFPGQQSFPERTPLNFVRLAYSFANPEEIRIGVAALGRAYSELVDRHVSPAPAPFLT